MADKRRQNAEAHLSWLLQFHRSTAPIPAIGAGIVIGAEVVATQVVGVRKWGHDEPAQIHDLFDLGSISKPLTGFLFARVADQGPLAFTTTIGQIFPDIIKDLKKPLATLGGVDVPSPTAEWANHYRDTTVTDLMTHTSGLDYRPRTPDEEAILGVFDSPRGSTPLEHLMKKRRVYAALAVKDKPFGADGWETVNGKKPFKYSGGCIVVASMLEETQSNTWESLMTNWVFTPLGIGHFSYGKMSAPDAITNTWHHKFEDGQIKTRSDLRTTQVATTHAPAGAVCLSMNALGKLLGAILTRDSTLMSADGWANYWTVPSDVNAIAQSGWLGQNGSFMHEGNAAGWNDAVAFVDLNRQIAYYACANIGTQDASTRLYEICGELSAMAEAFDLFQYSDEAVDARTMKVSADSTHEPRNGISYSAILMTDSWLSTGWKSKTFTPIITVEFDEPTSIKGFVLYQPAADVIQTMNVRFFPPSLEPVGPVHVGPVKEPVIGNVTVRSANGHVLRVLFPHVRKAKKLVIEMTSAVGLPVINQLLVMKA